MLLFEVIELTFLFGVKLHHFILGVDKEFKREYLNKNVAREGNEIFFYLDVSYLLQFEMSQLIVFYGQI